MASSAAGGASLTPSHEADEGAPPSASVMADRRVHPLPGATASRPAEADPQNTRKVPNYTAHFAAELVALAAEDRRIVGITAGMPTGHRADQAPGRVPGPVHRRRASPSSTRSRWRPASRSAACGRWSRCTRRSSSAPSTRPSTTSARTTRRCCSRWTARASSARTGPATRACSRSRPSACCRTSSSPARATSRSCARWCAPRSPRTTRSRCTTRATPGSASRSASPRSSRWGGARSCARAATCCSSPSARSPPRAIDVADLLEARGWSVGIINARFAKPLDTQLILDGARGKRLVVTFEESVVTGGFGSGVLEALEEARLADPAYRDVALKILGIPGDRFVDHGSVTDLRRLIRLDVAGLAAQVDETLAQLGITAPAAAG